jgi:hypothetical protein
VKRSCEGNRAKNRIARNDRVILAEDNEGRRYLVDVGGDALDLRHVLERARRPLRGRTLGKEPACELLRLRDVQAWLRISRDAIELLEREGKIMPFRKRRRAKAWYRKWQLAFEFLLPEEKQNKAPRSLFIHRADALVWLGVPAAEFESWVRCEIISARRFRDRWKAYYDVSEIKKNVLGLGG